uniref:Uncharacterized protein n=1 Tax=Caenorhabditis japonica TaxID=281687 RepID=A0A8R1ETL7_CAEJA
MDFFRVEPMTLYWSHIAFNLLCLIYGITVPYILHSTLPEWQKETRRLVHVLFRLSAVAEAPKSTFGEQMIYNDAAIETNVYFAEFNKRTR